MDLNTTLQPLVEKLQGWLDGAIALLPNLLVALLVIAFFVGLGKAAKKMATGVAERLEANVAITRLMATIAQYTIVLTGFLVALGVVGLQKAVLSVLAGAGVAGLAIGFAFQDLAANFIAGIAMGFRKPFEIGDVIETADYFGQVETINLRNTVVRTYEGQRVIIPNRKVFENPLINYHSNGSRRVEVEVGVAYDTDLPQATDVAREAVEGLSCRQDDSEIQILATSFGGSSIDFRIRFWIDFPGQNFVQAQHDAVIAIKRAFDEHDIAIPFPIRTLDPSLLGGTIRPLVADPEEAFAAA